MNKNNESKSFGQFILLWLTQSLSALGSAMTSYALVLWLYGESSSALYTAMLTITSYAPYVLLSIFAGALCDRFDKKENNAYMRQYSGVVYHYGYTAVCV